MFRAMTFVVARAVSAAGRWISQRAGWLRDRWIRYLAAAKRHAAVAEAAARLRAEATETARAWPDVLASWELPDHIREQP